MDNMNKQELIQNLRDASCDEAQIEQILSLLESKQQAEGIRLLRRQRCALMTELHTQQQKVDCLDYLLYQLQAGGK